MKSAIVRGTDSDPAVGAPGAESNNAPPGGAQWRHRAPIGGPTRSAAATGARSWLARPGGGRCDGAHLVRRRAGDDARPRRVRGRPGAALAGPRLAARAGPSARRPARRAL